MNLIRRPAPDPNADAAEDYRRRIEQKLRERGVPEADIPALAESLLSRPVGIDFRAAGLL